MKRKAAKPVLNARMFTTSAASPIHSLRPALSIGYIVVATPPLAKPLDQLAGG